MELIEFSVILANFLLSLCFLLYVFSLSKRIKVMIDKFPSDMLNFIVQTVKDNPDEIDSYIYSITQKMLPTLKSSILGSLGQEKRMLSLNLKGIENDLISGAVEGATGLPIGGLTLDILNKYPFLKSFLPSLIGGIQSPTEQKLKSSGELGKLE